MEITCDLIVFDKLTLKGEMNLICTTLTSQKDKFVAMVITLTCTSMIVSA